MVEQTDLERQVGEHYAHSTGGDVLGAVLAALDQLGRDTRALRYEDLGGIDHFHGGGRAATRALARLGELAAGERVLDIGGGFGGPARTLAAEFGCSVTVLDPTPAFVEAGRALTARIGLSDRVVFERGSGTQLPFADASFDVVWTQNASMNIQDKAALAREQFRVVRPGGRLVFQEVLAGPTPGELHYPVHWAREAATSFLVPPSFVRDLLRQSGFVERAWQDVSDETAASQATPPPAGRPEVNAATIVHGLDASVMRANTERNQAEGRARYICAVFVRPV